MSVYTFQDFEIVSLKLCQGLRWGDGGGIYSTSTTEKKIPLPSFQPFWPHKLQEMLAHKTDFWEFPFQVLHRQPSTSIKNV